MHALLLNNGYFQQIISTWNEEAILMRAESLTENILEIWPAIGELPAPNTDLGTRPITLFFLGQRFPVTTWRDVAEQTTEAIIQRADNFREIARAMPSYLSLEPFPRANRQLSNGWYMNVNLSSNSLKSYCRTLITKAGLTITDWQVEEN